MRLCRIGDRRLGLIREGVVLDVSAALAALPSLTWPPSLGDHLIAHLGLVAEAVERIAASAPIVEYPCFESPVAAPSKIIAAPLNYRRHVAEVKRDAEINAGTHATAFEGYATPIDKLGLFIKASSSLVGASHGIELVYPDRRTDHEVELVAVIGRGGRNISEADALAHVCGYAIGLDMTVRGPEDRSFRKSPDSYTVLGPELVLASEIADPLGLDLSLDVNGEVRQQANTADLIVDLPRLIAIASSCYTLYPGDLIMTGTPDGVGPVGVGDTITAKISGFADLKVQVKRAIADPGVHGQKEVAA